MSAHPLHSNHPATPCARARGPTGEARGVASVRTRALADRAAPCRARVVDRADALLVRPVSRSERDRASDRATRRRYGQLHFHRLRPVSVARVNGEARRHADWQVSARPRGSSRDSCETHRYTLWRTTETPSPCLEDYRDTLPVPPAPPAPPAPSRAKPAHPGARRTAWSRTRTAPLAGIRSASPRTWPPSTTRHSPLSHSRRRSLPAPHTPTRGTRLDGCSHRYTRPCPLLLSLPVASPTSAPRCLHAVRTPPRCLPQRLID